MTSNRRSLKYLEPSRRAIQQELEAIRTHLRAKQLKSLVITKEQFIDGVKTAVENESAYGAGRLGAAEEYWMYYALLRQQGKDSRAQRLETELPHYFMNQTGLFPATAQFIREYNQFYVGHLRTLDCIGLCYGQWELPLVRAYRLDQKARLVHYSQQEPDRSSPSREGLCYLPLFAGKKVLIICPFGTLLAQRANKETFEAVWAKTGKKWFYPASVDALEFPYGFVSETQQRYGTALRLFENIAEQISRRDFDVALVAAAGLGTPIVSHVRSMGKVAIYMGGHLQILFGVLGKRWRDRKDWQERYFNDRWIDMPDAWKPKTLVQGVKVCDNGAYW